MNILFEAILKLSPNANFYVENGEITWNSPDIEMPTQADIDAEVIKLQTEYDSKRYQRDRAVAYPSIQDVVVALAEKEEGDDTMWQEITAKRAKVKADNPKPS